MSSTGFSWLNNPAAYLQSTVGAPVTVTSGLRSPEHNAAVGGVPNSDHLNGNAFDFVPRGMSMQDAFTALQNSGAPIKQALNEGNHIHVAFNQPQTSVDPLDAALAAQASGKAVTQSQQAMPQGDALDAALAQQATPKPVSAGAFPQTAVRAGGAPQAGWLDTALHYATGGLMDKADALALTLGIPGGVQNGDFGTRYHQNLTNVRNEYGAYAADNPSMNKAAHAAGVVGPMLVGGGAPSGILGTVTKNAAMGAAYGLGGTDDSSVTGDLGAAGMGGLFGGTIGAAGHGVGSLAGGAAGSVADRLAGLQQTPGQRFAADTITANVPKQDLPPLIAQLSNATKPLTAMDIGGDNSALARQGRLLTVLPGQPGKDITDFLNTRQTGAPGIQGQRGRVLSDIAQIAPNTDTYGTKDDLAAERFAGSDPLYKVAFDQPAPRTDYLARLEQNPKIQQGMRAGLILQRDAADANNVPFKPSDYAITGWTDAGDPIIGNTPSWRTWHAAREGLDDMINSQKINGILPKTKAVNGLVNLRAKLNGALTTLNPDLAAADAAWSGPSQKIDAINMGTKFLNADPDEIARITGKMNSETLPSYQVGAGRSLRDVANDTRDNNNIPLRLNSDQTTRDQIGAAFGPDNAANFAGNMNLESQMAKTRQFMTGGSNTANKLADIGKGGALPILQDAISGALAGGLHGALVLPAVNVARRASMAWAENLLNNPNKNQELANVLTATGPDAARKIQDLLAAAQRRQRAATVGKMIGNAAGRGTIAGTLPALMAPAANNGP